MSDDNEEGRRHTPTQAAPKQFKAATDTTTCDISARCYASLMRDTAATCFLLAAMRRSLRAAAITLPRAKSRDFRQHRRRREDADAVEADAARKGRISIWRRFLIAFTPPAQSTPTPRQRRASDEQHEARRYAAQSASRAFPDRGVAARHYLLFYFHYFHVSVESTMTLPSCKQRKREILPRSRDFMRSAPMSRRRDDDDSRRRLHAQAMGRSAPSFARGRAEPAFPPPTGAGRPRPAFAYAHAVVDGDVTVPPTRAARARGL